MPTALRALLLAALLTVAPVTIGVLVSSAGAPTSPPAYTGTALADVDTATLFVARASFCDRISSDAVKAALGTAPTDGTTWSNGDPIAISGGEDIGHEFGCSFTTATAAAEAWVFAPPVTVADANVLVGDAGTARGCRALPDAPSYGDPSVATECGGKRPHVTFHGLFGDAWLSCRLQLPKRTVRTDAAMLDRAGRWCVAVAQAAAPRE